MFDDYMIILDVDWASDPIIAEVANYLVDNKIKTTWFITHDSPEIRRLSRHPHLFELGIHPNFTKESTQGKTQEDVMKYLQKIIPQAKSVRTHFLLQSTPLLKLLREEFNLLYDVSLFLPGNPNIIPHEIFFSKNLELLRFPSFWEDDFEMHRPNPSFSFSDNRYHVDGIKIFAFHPIHIILNSYDMKNYQICKSNLNINTLSNLKMEKYINKTKMGTGNFFKELVEFIKNSSFSPGLTVSDLANKWRTSNEINVQKNWVGKQ